MSFLKNLFKKDEEKEEKKGFFESLKEKLSASIGKDGLFGKVKSFFLGRSIINDELYEELEDILIQSDIGMDMTLKIVERLEKEVKIRKIENPQEVYGVLREVMTEFLIKDGTGLDINKPGLNVILVVGVNGVGKTTTIGKLASKLKAQGKAVVFDTIQLAKSKNADVAIIDTAGRLHNKNNLMKELEKINKILEKQLGEGTTYESLLVIDGTTGQNGLTQAKVFNEVTHLTGFVVTKLDGTAKGGIVFAISEELKKPIKLIGVGEGINDLREFDVEEYIGAIFN